MTTVKSATYRLQLQPQFGFDDVCKWADYLKALGISHIYTSPYLQPVSGSAHGYDVVDATRVNCELGGPQAHERMCETLQAKQLGHVIDIVPNHMAIAGQQNPWWWDVLENGPASRYATYFDVDWETTEERWQNKILLPVLGDHYGRVLEAGELRLVHKDAHFRLHYYEHAFPVDPSTLSDLLYRAAERVHSTTLTFLADSYARMPRPSLTAREEEVERRHRDKAVLFVLLTQSIAEHPEFAAAIDTEVALANEDVNALDALVEEQNYRLAYWRTASRDLGYRRFFDIADLAGLRIEDPKVFKDTHALPFEWVRKGWVQGLRIDHSDGLRDPKRYFERLRAECPDTWIVTEKILEPGETLRPEWPIAGTTGYEFLNSALQLFVHPDGKQPLSDFTESFTGENTDFQQVTDQCKEQVLNELLQSELNRLTTLFVNICEKHRRHRDFSKSELFEALSAVAQCLVVYRTYVSPNERHLHGDDLRYISQAIECAQVKRVDLDPELLEFLKAILCLRVPGNFEQELAMRFQQLTGPVMAKGLEDTAFYRYTRLMALNEVGGNPGQFGASLESFHRFAADIHSTRPSTMITSATHDTKRSEDVRARLVAISEVPNDWQIAVSSWHEINLRYQVDPVPASVEYTYYQALVGAWPISEERLQAYMEKAMREAKLHTSWTHPNEPFEQNLAAFITASLNDESFVSQVEEFVRNIATAGYYNSLSQTLIKLTAPGIPDIYQGNELWDFSLVDPDNRRPVDFQARAHMLDALKDANVSDVMANIEDGRAKMWLTHKALQVRAQFPEAFSPAGMYQALIAQGARADHVLVFARGNKAITVAPRFYLSRPEGWQDTRLKLPAGTWRNRLSNEVFEGGDCELTKLLHSFPVALLTQEENQ